MPSKLQQRIELKRLLDEKDAKIKCQLNELAEKNKAIIDWKNQVANQVHIILARDGEIDQLTKLLVKKDASPPVEEPIDAIINHLDDSVDKLKKMNDADVRIINEILDETCPECKLDPNTDLHPTKIEAVNESKQEMITQYLETIDRIQSKCRHEWLLGADQDLCAICEKLRKH